jgi:hypothetical protein
MLGSDNNCGGRLLCMIAMQKTISFALSIFLLARFVLTMASCEKAHEHAYYYPSQYSKAAQGDIGDNLSWRLLLESR